MTMFFLLVLLLAFILPFILVDLYVNGKEWLMRIHIGRWQDVDTWETAVKGKVSCWLRKTPTIPVTDNDRWILLDILQGNYSCGNIQSWQIAGMLLAVDRKDAEKYIGNHPFTLDANHVLPEQIMLAYALKKHDLLTLENERILHQWFSRFNEKGETIPYRQSEENIRYVDTLGMIVPYLAISGFDQLAVRQMEEYDRILLHGVFPPHAYNLTFGYPLGVFDWGRGIGWYVLSLVFAPELKGNTERLLRLAKALLPLQQQGGGFSHMLFTPSLRMESSATASIGLLFVEVYRQTKDTGFLDAACHCRQALQSATRRDGVVDYCQGDTRGMGNYSRRFSTMPFAQGMACLLSKQLKQYEA